MFCSALRSREVLIAKIFPADEIQVHPVCAVSFIDIIRIDGLCLEAWDYLDVDEGFHDKN